MFDLSKIGGDLIFTVRVVPRSSRSEIVGEHAGALKIKISSAPVDGAANKELIIILSKILKVPKSNIEIINGETARKKTIKIYGMDSKRFLKKISS